MNYDLQNLFKKGCAIKEPDSAWQSLNESDKLLRIFAFQYCVLHSKDSSVSYKIGRSKEIAGSLSDQIKIAKL